MEVTEAMSDRARQFLSRAKKIDSEIDVLLRAKQETLDRVLSITQKYDADGAQSSKDPHKYDRLVELESMIDQKTDELLEVKKEITDTIMQLPERRFRCVMLDAYIRMMTFEQIAVEQHYSYRQVKRIHSKGLVLIDGYLTGN